MNVDPKDDLDRAIDETLASMLEGEPRQVSGASVRRAMGRSARSSLPVWLAVAAVLIVALTVALPGRAPVESPRQSAARVVTPSASIEPRSASSEPAPAPSATPSRVASVRSRVAMTTEPVYEGLPRLTIDSIEPPQPLRPARIADEPLRIPTLETPPLAVSGLSNEPDHD